jgi:hypothetical protein
MSLLSRRGNLTPEQLDLVRDLVQRGIAFAEEWAVGRLKETGQKPHSLEKSAVAVKAAKTLAGPGLGKKVGDERWAVAVQAELPEVRRRATATGPSPLPPLRRPLP